MRENVKFWGKPIKRLDTLFWNINKQKKDIKVQTENKEIYHHSYLKIFYV